MRRREFISLLGGAAAAWPLAARAQQSAMPVVGFLRSTPSAPFQNLVVAFGQGLKEEGFVEGQNAVVDYRYADNQIDRLPALVAELIHRPVSARRPWVHSPTMAAGVTTALAAALLPNCRPKSCNTAK